MRPVELLVKACGPARDLLSSPLLGAAWSEPSVLAGWTNGGLAGHLARSAFNLERVLDQPAADAPVVDSVAYYVRSAPELPESRTSRRIVELGYSEAAAGQAALVERFTSSAERLREKAVPSPPTVVVTMFGRNLLIDECATACLLELVVHSDDLAVGVGASTPAFGSAVMDLVTRTLCGISRFRHGELAVLRALSRSERAPAAGVSAFRPG